MKSECSALWCCCLFVWMSVVSAGSSFCGATPRAMATINGLAFIANFTIEPPFSSNSSGTYEMALDSIDGPCSFRGDYRYIEANATYQITSLSSYNGTCPSPVFCVTSAVVISSESGELLLSGYTNTPGGSSVTEWELEVFASACSSAAPVNVYCATVFDVNARIIIAPAWNFTLDVDASKPCAISGRYALTPSSSAPVGTAEVDVVVFASSCASYLTFGDVYFGYAPSNVPQINISGALFGIPWNALATPSNC